MSAFCNKYPACGCVDIGKRCYDESTLVEEGMNDFLGKKRIAEIERCDFCGNVGFKTNGHSQVICKNRAMTGKCEGNKITVLTPFRATTKTSRNHPCPCGSGKKFKRCCMR